MSLQSVPLLSFDFFPSRPVQVEVSTSPLTSDAGLLPIRQFDGQVRLTEQFAAAIEGRSGTRVSSSVEHSALSMVRQRIFGILRPTTRTRMTTIHCVVFSLQSDRGSLAR